MIKKIPYRRRVLILLFFLILITYLDRVTISLVGVRIKDAFHLSNTQFGWVVGAFSIAYALFEIPSGMLSDRIGQRAVLIRIVLMWSLFTALTGAVTGLTSLLLIRFLFGIGESGAFPTSSSTIGRWFPLTERGRSMSALFIGQNTGAAVAPLIVVPIAIHFGWRAPFFVNGLIGLVWVIICWLWFRNEPSEMKGISQEEVVLIEKERRFLKHNEPFPWRAVLSNRRIWAILIAFFCSQWGLYFFVAWMPVYLQQGRHLSEVHMKQITSFLFVLAIGGAFFSGIMSDWLVKKKGLVFGRRFIGLFGMGMAGLFLIVTAISTSNFIAVTCLLICGFCYSFYSLNAFSTCVDIGGAKSGTMVGIMNFCGQTGAFLLSIVFGKIADAVHNYNTPVLLIAGILIMGSIVWMGIDPTNKIENLKANHINKKGN